jgi:hypothetical protein
MQQFWREFPFFNVTTGEEPKMAHDGEYSRMAGRPAGARSERTAEESARPAWAKPAVRRFSLQKTLAGSGAFHDGGLASQVTPT